MADWADFLQWTHCFRRPVNAHSGSTAKAGAETRDFGIGEFMRSRWGGLIRHRHLILDAQLLGNVEQDETRLGSARDT